MFQDLISRFNSINPLNNKIYYAAAIWGNARDPKFNLELIEHIKRYGSVLSEQLFLPDYKNKEHLDRVAIHNRDIKWIRQSKFVVAEVTGLSLGVGYELREAVRTGKKVLALLNSSECSRLSAMISGAPGITVAEYQSIDQAKEKIDLFFNS